MTMLSLPLVPKTKIDFEGSETPIIPPSAGSIVAVIGAEHDWGPTGAELAETKVYTRFSDYITDYGDSDTPLRTAVAQAFIGQGVASQGGAGGVIVVRMAPGSAAASVTINNTAGTPAPALTLKARWKGVRGNDYGYRIDADPQNPSTQDRLRIYYKGALVETFVYPKTNIAQLAGDITARTTFPLTVDGAVVSGTALGTASSTVALTGGSNGTTITSADYVAAAQILEFKGFAVLAPYNLTDDATFTALLSWVRAQVEANRPVILAIGGGDADSLSTAIARSALMNDPHVVNLGVGVYHDDLLDKNLNTAQLAPRIAGIIAARGEKSALTAALLGGLTVVGGAGVSEADASAAATGGVTTLIRTENPNASLRVARGVTTWTTTTDPTRPKKIFSEPRFIRIMDNFVRAIRLWGDDQVIGDLPVNADTRDAVRQRVSQEIDRLLRNGLILTQAQGAKADPFVRTPVTTDDTLPFEFGWQFAYTTNYLLGSGSVS